MIAMAICSIIPVSAKDFVAVTKNGNVYDEASAKYITVNQDNEDVAVIPGMVFAASQHTPGWYMVEYSPGIHAFIPDHITSTSLNPVPAGTYTLQNNPQQQITVQGSGDNWNATVDGNSYKGQEVQNILIFTDALGNIAYSVVDFGTGPIAITYDNSVTKFF